MQRVLFTKKFMMGLMLVYSALIFLTSFLWPDKMLAVFTLTLVLTLLLYTIDYDEMDDGSEGPMLVGFCGVLMGLHCTYALFFDSDYYVTITGLPAFGISISVLYLAYKARKPKRQKQDDIAVSISDINWTIYHGSTNRNTVVYKDKLTLNQAIDSLAELRLAGKLDMRACSKIDGTEVYVELDKKFKFPNKLNQLIPKYKSHRTD